MVDNQQQSRRKAKRLQSVSSSQKTSHKRSGKSQRPSPPFHAPTTTHSNTTTLSLSSSDTWQTSHCAHTANTDLPQSPYSRTLRLSQIPGSIGEDLLRKYLTDLKCQLADTSEISGFSLGPFRDWLVATVSFVDEPLIFRECRTGHQTHPRLPGGESFTVDCDFYGMTILYHPPSNPEYDLIAVSGLSAHAFGSWKSPLQSHVMWLRDCVKDDFPNCRVFAWGYDSDLEDSSATMSICGYAQKLLIAIRVARGGGKNDLLRPIIFVGHSLGGLIIKQALVLAARGGEEESLPDKMTLRSCVGLFLFGVPNKGLNEENLSSLVKFKKSAPFVTSLMEGSDLLENMHSQFRQTFDNYLDSCYVVSFFETKDSPIIEETAGGKWRRNPAKLIRMVTKESATGFTPREANYNQISIASDHSKLVKFRGRDDDNYLTFYVKMKELVDSLPAILGGRGELCSNADILLDEAINPADPQPVSPKSIGAEAAVGIPAVFVLTLRALRTLRKRNFGKSLLHLSRDFETEGNMFKQYILDIFYDRGYRAEVARLLDNPDAEGWINAPITAFAEGNSVNINGELLHEVESLKELIETFLLRLPSSGVSGDEKFYTTAVQLTHNVLRKCFQSPRKRSHRFRGVESRMAQKEITSDPHYLLDGIRQCNKKLAEFIRLKHQQSTRISESRAPPTLSIFPDATSVATLECSQKVRSISTILYRALSKCTSCSCHELYMRLETSQKPVPYFTGADAQPLIHFSVLLADKAVELPLRSQHMQLDIIKEKSQHSAISGVSHQIVKLCATELHDTIDLGGQFLEGFLVCHNRTDTAEIAIRKSLKELLNEKSTNHAEKLGVGLKLGLGLKLGNAAIHFHSTPWIKFWDIERVSVFTTSGNQRNIHALMPHVLIELTADDLSTDTLCDLYQLGLMLLEIVGYDSGGFQKSANMRGKEWFKPNWELVDSLRRDVGVPYMKLVKGFLEVGLKSHGHADDEDLETLVGLLQGLDSFLTNYG